MGNAFTILTAPDGLNGTFDSLTAPLGYNWYVKYDANDIQLVVGIPGDYNHDGVVDTADYTVWRDSLGSTTNLAADGNGDGVIDQGDYDFWKNRFGTTHGVGSGATVSEPSTAVLLVAAAVILIGRGRRAAR